MTGRRGFRFCPDCGTENHVKCKQCQCGFLWIKKPETIAKHDSKSLYVATCTCSFKTPPVALTEQSALQGLYAHLRSSGTKTCNPRQLINTLNNNVREIKVGEMQKAIELTRYSYG